MSLEVTLIPLAFVIVNVLDHEYYKSWMKRKRVEKKTDYESIDDFIADINKTNYKYSVYQGTVRICGNNGKIFYFVKQQNKWVLSFSEYDDKQEIGDFLKMLSKVSAGKVTEELPLFSDTRKSEIQISAGNNTMPVLGKKEAILYPTIYNDESLLLEGLKRMGISYTRKGNNIEYIKDDVTITFIKNTDGKFYMRTVGDISEEEVYRSLQELDIIYKKDVQRQAYENVMKELSKHNASIVKETIAEDETIVLTLNVD